MKTVFIFNPAAGKGKTVEKLKSEILQTAAKLGVEVEFYDTKAKGDAARFIKEYCKENDCTRFVACGGDGTFSEVVNGIAEVPGAVAGVLPLGTGNDFCRNFPKEHDFKNVAALLLGETVKCDAIKYTSETVRGYCANMVNIGFDCNVADLTGRLKKKKFIDGSFAYFVSIFIMLIKKKGANIKVIADEKELHSGKLLLNSIANGKYCGGGIQSNPDAELNDGKMDINVVYNISRLNFLSKLPFYMKGTHKKLKNIEKAIYSQKCRKMVVTPLDGTMRICVDGDIIETGETVFEIVPEAFDFIVPKPFK